jgi:hypothetical protein
MIRRAELRALFAEDDKLRAEHRDWKARCEVQAQALVQKPEADGLQYRTCENSGSQGPTVHEAEAICEEPSANDELVDALVVHSKALGDAVLDLRRENDKLKAQLDLVLQLIGSPVGWANMLAGVCAQRDSARAELAEARRENAELRHELTELRHLRELMQARQARQDAERELAALYRQRPVEQAQQATRDPARPLH